jgi:MFS transporter, DHA1 family, multidrug resistance protein
MPLFTNGCKEHSSNYKIFLGASTLLSLASGLFTPFWVVFVQGFGSMASFGFALGLMGIFNAITNYYAGKYSDRFGRKGFLIVSGYGMAAVAFAFTLITSIEQLYAVQVIFGVMMAVQCVSESSFLGDITVKETRGTDLGRLEAVTGIVAALAMMGGGLIVDEYGIATIFYIVAFLRAVSTTVLFFLNET